MLSLDSTASEGNQTSFGRGWIVSLIAHLAIIALFFIPIIVAQAPPPEEEGVMVSLGMPDEGEGDEAPSRQEEKPTPQVQPKKVELVEKPAPSSPQKQVSSKVITSNEQDAVLVREAEAKRQAQAEAKRQADEEAKRQQAYNSTKKSYGDLLGGSGRGNTGKPGSQGVPNGDPNAKALEGISKGSGRVGGGLGNRGVLHEPSINDASQKTGTVVISVCVDKNGKVIRADYTQKGSTTTDTELKDIARRAALKFKFTDSDIEEQCGTITVDFKIKGQ